MDLKILSKKYIKAKEYEELIHTKGYERLKTEKLEFLQRKEREKTLNGLKPNYQLDEELLEGRTYLRLFEELENWAKNKDKFKEQFEKNGVKIEL